MSQNQAHFVARRGCGPPTRTTTSTSAAMPDARTARSGQSPAGLADRHAGGRHPPPQVLLHLGLRDRLAVRAGRSRRSRLTSPDQSPGSAAPTPSDSVGRPAGRRRSPPTAPSGRTGSAVGDRSRREVAARPGQDDLGHPAGVQVRPEGEPATRARAALAAAPASPASSSSAAAIRTAWMIRSAVEGSERRVMATCRGWRVGGAPSRPDRAPTLPRRCGHRSA